jgi:hypothetical protein
MICDAEKILTEFAPIKSKTPYVCDNKDWSADDDIKWNNESTPL